VLVVPSVGVLPNWPTTERIFASTQYFLPVRLERAENSQCLEVPSASSSNSSSKPALIKRLATISS